jgi:hypothetical protein
MTMFTKCAGLLAALALIAHSPAAAQQPARGGSDPASEKLTYPIEFDSVETYLMSLVPPSGREDVRNLQLSAEQQNLRVDADVKLGGLPGLELFGAFGFTHLTATGPVEVVRPGVVAWNVQNAKLAGTNVSPAVWAPLLQRATKREDTRIPFRVGQWVQKVDVEPTRLVLH